MQYQWSDAWLLQSIIYANIDGEGTLDRIFEYADGLQHTLINRDELHSGLVRLTSGGLITESEGKFKPTEKVPAKFTTGINTNKIKEQDQIRKYLKADGWTPETNTNNPCNSLIYPGLTDEMIRSADRNYLKRFHNKLMDLEY